ncbi:hypothetical protein BHE74_00005651 [Ensete ventricosum]|nr:hypothetical protein BHE74_00005651 [Ensete ventricosum]
MDAFPSMEGLRRRNMVVLFLHWTSCEVLVSPPSRDMLAHDPQALGFSWPSPKLTPVSTDASMEGDEECHTPTSEETRVPVFPRICPPAPKKTRRRLAPCKRRRWSSEPELIVVGTEEMEQLFRWRDQQKDDHSHAKKRRVHKTSEIS